MKTTRVVLFLTVLSILWCTDVFAHNNPAAHFAPGTTDDPCKGTGCDVGSDYDGGHGHITEYEDLGGGMGYDHGIDDATSWRYWDRCGYAAGYWN